MAPVGICPESLDPSAFLIVTDAGHNAYCGFSVIRWADICIKLRRMLPYVCRNLGLVKAAMFVAFVSAVERNLLHFDFSGTSAKGPIGYDLLADHLRRALE